MSLNDLWQQQRQQRQQEVLQRQQTVYQSLAAMRQERGTKAAQLRDELSLFREALLSHDQIRRSAFQPFHAELQQFCVLLRAEMQAFLVAASDRRQIQAADIVQTLNAFVQRLRQQNVEFLALAQAERVAMAQKLEQELVAFVDDLRSDVQSYLVELEAVRQQRAVQVDQMLMQSRAEREAETQALYQQLAVFRTELREFCCNLHRTVWGNAGSPVPLKAPVAKSQPSQNGSRSVSRVSGLPSSVAVPTTVGAFQHGNSVAVIPPAKAAKAPQKEAVTYEKEVYNHLQSVQGARLTEIESSLGINRFQAVDALRSLIKQGRVTQRDRIYLIQESLSHV